MPRCSRRLYPIEGSTDTDCTSEVCQFVFLICLPVAPELMTFSAEQQCDVLQQHLQLFLQVLAQFVTSPSPHKRDVGVQCLESLLARQQVRQAVWANSAIIPG